MSDVHRALRVVYNIFLKICFPCFLTSKFGVWRFGKPHSYCIHTFYYTTICCVVVDGSPFAVYILHQDSMSDLTASRFREYKVMYTNELTQKRKRWHDGTLRVFEFNNKCFLKDDVLGQLVETSFVDGSTAFNEGDLVELEGVLVEVEYLLGVYERDASSVINGSLEKHAVDIKPITKVVWESKERQSQEDCKVFHGSTDQVEQRPRWRPVGLPHPRCKKRGYN